jgi:uncharacterized protein
MTGFYNQYENTTFNYTTNLSRSLMKKRLFTLTLLFASIVLCAQPPQSQPQRKAFTGLMAKTVNNEVQVDSVLAGGSFANSQIRKGDILVSVNNQSVKKVEELAAALAAARNGDEITAEYRRGNTIKKEKFKAVGRPYIQSAVANVKYDWVPFKSGSLRTITYQPKDKTNCPAILLIPGYGCGSIENYPTSYNGKLLNEWVKNGYAVVTIEKSGLGDSYGCAPCVEVDLATDIESFDAGYRYMEQLPFVDKNRLFIWGHSMGGTIAPEIAKLHHPKGVMVFACVFRPWSEFLLEMHRVQKPLMEGLNYEQTEDFVRTIQKIYYEFFVLKKTPQQLHEVPAYKAVVESELNYKDGNTNMWGRHWRFWQQLDSVNLAKSWQQVGCQVLVLHGGADYEQCSMVEPLMIKQTVNEKHPGFATWVTIPDLDHFMMKSKDWKDAYQNFKAQGYMKGNFNEKIVLETIEWLKKIDN